MNHRQIHIINSTFNPKKGWAKNYIDRALAIDNILGSNSINFILVNDGSTNNLSKDISYIRSKVDNFYFVEYADNKGKGHAIRTGINYANADYYIYTDVDFPYTTESYYQILQHAIDSKADVVIGTRPKSYFKSIPFQRRLISSALIILNKYFFRLPYPDTQAGIKLIRHSATEIFTNVKTNGFLFEVEFLKKACKALSTSQQIVWLRSDITLSKISPKTLWNLLREYVKL